MMTAVRILGGIVAGLVVAFALVILLELLSSVLHPFQKDVAQTHEEICAHVARYPHWALALLETLTQLDFRSFPITGKRLIFAVDELRGLDHGGSCDDQATVD